MKEEIGCGINVDLKWFYGGSPGAAMQHPLQFSAGKNHFFLRFNGHFHFISTMIIIVESTWSPSGMLVAWLVG
jgi:hypothetical protein